MYLIIVILKITIFVHMNVKNKILITVNGKLPNRTKAENKKRV